MSLKLILPMRTSARPVVRGHLRRSLHDGGPCPPSPAASVAVLDCCTPPVAGQAKVSTRYEGPSGDRGGALTSSRLPESNR